MSHLILVFLDFQKPNKCDFGCDMLYRKVSHLICDTFRCDMSHPKSLRRTFGCNILGISSHPMPIFVIVDTGFRSEIHGSQKVSLHGLSQRQCVLPSQCPGIHPMHSFRSLFFDINTCLIDCLKRLILSDYFCYSAHIVSCSCFPE